MNKQEQILVNKIMKAEPGQYKYSNLVKTLSLAAAALARDLEFDQLNKLVKKAKKLMEVEKVEREERRNGNDTPDTKEKGSDQLKNLFS